MVAAKSSRVNRQYKKKYRIRNWREYERGLRSRGDVTIWLSEDAIAAWVPPKNGLRGGQRRYSNLAVRTALTLRVVCSLPLRQTEGFLDSLLRLMGLNLKAPDHTTLSRRNQIVAVPPLTRSYDGPIDLIVDSTGLKILGCGEWNAHKHKASKKRRDWRKLHIGVDAEGFIVAAELTASSRDDASTLPALLDTIEVPIRRFTADGAYDHRSVYDQLSAAGTENVVIVIPPRRSAVSAGPTDGPWAQRDTAVVCAITLGGAPYQVILLAQAGNGIVLPLILILLLIVVNKTRIMGPHRNSRLANVLGAIVVLVISGLSLLQLARVLGLVG